MNKNDEFKLIRQEIKDEAAKLAIEAENALNGEKDIEVYYL